MGCPAFLPSIINLKPSKKKIINNKYLQYKTVQQAYSGTYRIQFSQSWPYIAKIRYLLDLI
ncbi:hypothetical protein ACFP3I_24690 [Chryseobacterium arachidis]|uniref:hypothetical protein n=1 Tax=Chryseobacterium arachidis TaxID=1416778 RepID=UPI00360D619F